MKRGLVLFPKSTLERGATAFDWWKKAAEKNGISVDIAFFEDFIVAYRGGGYCEMINGVDADDYDFVIMRGYNAELSMNFESRGVRVYNRWLPMSLCRDKLIAHQILSATGVPMPFTVRSFGAMTYSEASGYFDEPVFVVKAPVGSCGEKVFLVHNEEEFCAATEACGGEYLIQEFIAESAGRDVRVWTVGGEAVAAVMRYSDTSFRSNYSCGGKVSEFKLTDEIADLAAKASRTLGLDFAGIDILLGKNGPCVCEVNGNAGFRTLSAVGGPDILDTLFKYIATKR